MKSGPCSPAATRLGRCVRGNAGDARAVLAHRDEPELGPRQQQGGAQPEATHPRHDHQGDRAQRRAPLHTGAHRQPDHHEDEQGHAQHHEALGVAPVDRRPHDQRQEHAVSHAVPAPHEEHDCGDDPTRPARHRGVGPSGVVDHGARQLEDGAAERGAEGSEPEHAAQGVGTGPGDQEPDQHDDGVRVPHGEQVAQRGGDAEHARLPVERQGHAQEVVGVPQRQLPVVDLGPRQVRPRDHLLDLVSLDGVVHGRPGALGEPETRQKVEGAERHAGVQRAHQDECGCEHGPYHAQHVRSPSARARRAALRDGRSLSRYGFRLVPLLSRLHVRSLRAAPRDAR